MSERHEAGWRILHDYLPHGRLRRYRQVLRILARHGFGWLLGQLGVAHLVPIPWGPFGRHRPPAYTGAERMRLALEELGVTFVKLGQILSTRSDLLPPDYIAELSRLQDAVPPQATEVIQAVITRELGSPPLELFASFDPVPLGSASIGQVHAARLSSGEEVVVKVQRPGVEALVHEDLAILRDLARLAANRTLWGQIYDLPGLVEEFASTIRGEMDYLQEARNVGRFRHSFAEEPKLRVPRVYRQYTTRRVLTLERLHGIKINDLAELKRSGVDRAQLARDGARIALKMVLEDGFFHADPHPGNFLVTPDGVIGLLDYGMVGQVDEPTRDGLLYLLLAVANQDLDRMVDQLIALGVMGSSLQLEQLRRDLGHLLSIYWGRPVREIDVTRVLEESLEIARRHQLQVPTRLVLLGKTMAMNEGLARNLDPQFNMAAILRPYAFRLALERYLPNQWRRRLLPAVIDLSRLAVTLPRRTERILTQLERGNLAVNMRIQEVEHILDVVTSLANRLVLGILAGSFAIAIALLLQLYYSGAPRWLFDWLLGVGLAVVMALGVWIAAGIVRRGHH